ncbi:MFS transporter [Aggregatilinea lenta]|uniref:MFS transporter n=1 Tax=Aggregatilinea lenta TaxID=913108 RepID=UPI000E5B8CA3|nr:MFS transporter [Aggregatilinea lenta]
MSTETARENLPGYSKRWIGLLFIGISLLVISLDNTILNVALPSISNDLGASASDLQWIVDAYVLVFAALLLTMGSFGDKIGRKRALQFGLVMFGIGSLWAALSTSTEMLIAARAFLGIGGATIMPATLSIISATFPREERSQAIAVWAAIFGLGVGIGPVVGGLLLEQFEWNAVFFVNLPVVAIALLGGAFFLAESKDEHAPKPDIIGVLLSVPGLFALIYGIIEAGQGAWTDSHVLIAFGISAVLLTIFTWWENRSPNAMLPLHFFKNMSFTGANIAMTFIMFSMFGSIFFLSQYLQTIQGYSALDAGLRMVPMAVSLAGVSVLSARIARRLGTKRTVALGITIAAGGLVFMSQMYDVDTAYSTVVVGQIILASGMGFAMSPATNSIMGSVPVSKAGVGSAMNDTTRQLGGALGIAVLGTIMNGRYLDGIVSLKTALPQLRPDMFDGISNSIQAAHKIASNPEVPEPFANTIIGIADQAFVTGMNDAMLFGAAVMLVNALLVLIILPSRVRAPREEAHVEEAHEHDLPSVAVASD